MARRSTGPIDHVVPGAVGADTTEVLSGLTEGQHVVLPDGAH